MKITDINGTATLHNGIAMPYFGLGVYQSGNGKEVKDAVRFALDSGYRHIDTAAAYQNEAVVGQAIRHHSVNREDIFITTKLWNSDQGYDKTIRAFYAALEKLQTSYIDLFLQHWPVKEKYKETWRAMETLYNEGRIRAIGVSNFLQFQLEELMGSSKIVPMVNQVEFYPFLVQQPLLDFCRSNNIQFESWFPLMHGEALKIPFFIEMAAKNNITVPQLLLRWNLQKGAVVIPKSVNQQRIIANTQLFDFELSPDDMLAMDSQDSGLRMGPDPATFNF